MSVLHCFMIDLLAHYEGEFDLVVDNARMTTNQKVLPLPLTRDSLHSNSLHSSNHSTTRWEMNDSSHSTGPGASCSSNSSHASVLTAPIRKASTDPPSQLFIKSSSSKPKAKKEKRKGKKTKKALVSPSIGMPPLSPSYKKKASISTTSTHNLTGTPKKQKPMNQKHKRRINSAKPSYKTNSSLMLIKPSRQLSPILSCDPSVTSLKTYLRDQGRSLSKTLGVADVHPQAPKLPTRKPSSQPDLFSPVPAPSSVGYYAKMLGNKASIHPKDRSSSNRTSLDRTITEVIEPPLFAGYRRRVFVKPSGKWLRPLSKRP